MIALDDQWRINGHNQVLILHRQIIHVYDIFRILAYSQFDQTFYNKKKNSNFIKESNSYILRLLQREDISKLAGFDSTWNCEGNLPPKMACCTAFSRNVCLFKCSIPLVSRCHTTDKSLINLSTPLIC